MSDERCDRDRVTAILTLAKAEPDLRPIVRAAISDPSRVTPRTNAPGLAAETLSEWRARAVLRRIGARTSETVWLARRLLEALDTIDRLEAENEELRETSSAEYRAWCSENLTRPEQM